MRKNFALIITVVVVVLALIVLNAASYVNPEQEPETEYSPDRSTYNARATGTRALYDLLSESGRRVMRWQEAPQALLNEVGEEAPTTFVVVGKTQVPFEKDEADSLL